MSSSTKSSVAVNPLTTIANKLILKAFRAKNLNALKFVILNDTIHMVRYDQAHLLHIEKGKAKIAGVSGQSKFIPNEDANQHWSSFIEHIPRPDQAQELHREEFKKISKTLNALRIPQDVTMIWLPIPTDTSGIYGLLLQKHSKPQQGYLPEQVMNVLTDYLIPGYGLALSQKEKKGVASFLKKMFSGKYQRLIPLFFVLVLFLRVPLRIVAPCEVVPQDPVIISAPLEGIISEVLVRPGQQVEENDVVFEYDKRVPLKRLEVARKKVDILNSELDRAIVLSLEDDPVAMKELTVVRLKLERERLELALAELQASQLTATAPINGVVVIDDPNEWRGKPVSVGQKILSVIEHHKSMVRLWIPEKDNIMFDQSKPVKVILDINPNISYQAELKYIANKSTINKEEIPSFMAEAEWVDEPKKIKIGLEGTAILYGEKVSLFYYLIRKPWGYLRYLLGT